MDNTTFSDRLTPGQIKKIFDALRLPWRRHYNPENGGWVNLPLVDRFDSDLSVNIQHGGFVDQYLAGHPESYIDEIPARGDIVTLVAWWNWQDRNATAKAIEWMQGVLGMGKGVKPPELKDDRLFAKDFSDNGNGKFVRLPKDILRSDLTASEKLVWAAIFDRCGENEIYSYPGFRRLSKDTGLAIGTVQKAVKNLINYNLLIEKSRGAGKAPARFPLIAAEDDINKTVGMAGDTVSNSEHPPYQIVNRGVSNSELNYTQRTKPNKLNPDSIKGKPTVLPPGSGAFAFSEKHKETLSLLLAELNIKAIPAPPTGYRSAFLATLMKTPHGFNQWTGEIFDQRGYPAAWDDIQIDEGSQQAINDADAGELPESIAIPA